MYIMISKRQSMAYKLIFAEDVQMLEWLIVGCSIFEMARKSRIKFLCFSFSHPQIIIHLFSFGIRGKLCSSNMALHVVRKILLILQLSFACSVILVNIVTDSTGKQDFLSNNSTYKKYYVLRYFVLRNHIKLPIHYSTNSCTIYYLNGYCNVAASDCCDPWVPIKVFEPYANLDNRIENEYGDQYHTSSSSAPHKYQYMSPQDDLVSYSNVKVQYMKPYTKFQVR